MKPTLHNLNFTWPNSNQKEQLSAFAATKNLRIVMNYCTFCHTKHCYLNFVNWNSFPSKCSIWVQFLIKSIINEVSRLRTHEKRMEHIYHPTASSIWAPFTNTLSLMIISLQIILLLFFHSIYILYYFFYCSHSTLWTILS